MGLITLPKGGIIHDETNEFVSNGYKGQATNEFMNVYNIDPEWYQVVNNREMSFMRKGREI